MDNVENPFDRREIAESYEAYFETEEGKEIDNEEKQLIRSLVPKGNGKRLLDVGCGTGYFSRFLAGLDYNVTGLDFSEAMLVVAKKKGGVNYLLGKAEELPFPDSSFHGAVLFTVLEFVKDPIMIIDELIRVADECIFIAILNKWGPLNIKRYINNLWGKKDIFSAARFYSLSDMKKMIVKSSKNAGRRCDIKWGSALGPRVLSTTFTRALFSEFILIRVELKT